jgi:hypothetical protein
MARPIEPTPVLRGEDAEKLAASIADVASRPEIERRVAGARSFLAEISTPKPFADSRDKARR